MRPSDEEVTISRDQFEELLQVTNLFDIGRMGRAQYFQAMLRICPRLHMDGSVTHLVVLGLGAGIRFAPRVFWDPWQSVEMQVRPPATR